MVFLITMNSLEIRVNKDYKRKAERKTGDNNSTLKFTLRRNVPKTNKQIKGLRGMVTTHRGEERMILTSLISKTTNRK